MYFYLCKKNSFKIFVYLLIYVLNICSVCYRNCSAAVKHVAIKFKSRLPQFNGSENVDRTVGMFKPSYKNLFPQDNVCDSVANKSFDMEGNRWKCNSFIQPSNYFCLLFPLLFILQSLVDNLFIFLMFVKIIAGWYFISLC